jgi:aminopeptidase N
MTPRPLVALIATALLLGGCSTDDEAPAAEPSGPAPSSTPSSTPSTDPADDPADDPAFDAGLSEPVEDRVYPRVGDPGVDALHYDLALAWDPDDRELTASEVLTFRATGDDDVVRLDLSPALSVSSATLDGEPVDARQQGKDLLVVADVVAGERYTLALDYAGTPAPVEAPTTRADVPSLGWTTTADGSVWTMQEPYGAYTWYAVNDQPSDKALYDVTLTAPDPMVGVSNGELTSRTASGESTVTEWHLAEPAAAYLMTVAFGDYVTDEVRSEGGVPVSLFVDSTSGMETQTMITLGSTDYTFSMPVLVHEVVHQWWGDQVTPRDWRDLWMNEGMTMYLQAMWESENGGTPLEQRMDEWAAAGQELRGQAGPPAAYDKAAFAEPNVYYLPAVMWHDVRAEVGDEEFFRLVRDWPASRDNDNADYDEILRWWSQRSGTDLGPLFRAHLLGEDQPAA